MPECPGNRGGVQPCKQLADASGLGPSYQHPVGNNVPSSRCYTRSTAQGRTRPHTARTLPPHCRRRCRAPHRWTERPWRDTPCGSKAACQIAPLLWRALGRAPTHLHPVPTPLLSSTKAMGRDQVFSSTRSKLLLTMTEPQLLEIIN